MYCQVLNIKKMNKISASIMCIEFISIIDIMKKIENYVDYFHIDIMDGNFVPNITLGFYQVNALKRIFSKPFDYHLMINNPEKYIDYINLSEGDIVSIHIESTNKMGEIIKLLRSLKVKVYIALNPTTDFSEVREYLDLIDGILIMTVNPGFAGQKIIPETLSKIRIIAEYLHENNLNLDIQVDGNVSFENAEYMSINGANNFVVGTSSVFSNNHHVANITKFKDIISYE